MVVSDKESQVENKYLRQKQYLSMEVFHLNNTKKLDRYPKFCTESYTPMGSVKPITMFQDTLFEKQILVKHLDSLALLI